MSEPNLLIFFFKETKEMSIDWHFIVHLNHKIVTKGGDLVLSKLFSLI